MKKKLFTALGIIPLMLVVLLLTGCNFFNPKIKLDSADTAAEGFVKHLLNRAEDIQLSWIYHPEDSEYITQEDLDWFMPRSEFRDYYNQGGKITGSYVPAGEDTRIVEVYIEDKSGNSKISVNVKLNQNNEWRIMLEGFFIEKAGLSVPGGADVYLNDEKVSEDYITGENSGREEYEIPFIVNRERTLRLEYTNLEPKSYEEVIEFKPMEGNKVQFVRISVPIDLTLAKEMKDNFKNSFNSMMKNIYDGGNFKDIQHIFSESANLEEMEKFYNVWKENNTKGISSVWVYNDIRITEIQNRKDTSPFRTHNDIASINIRVRRAWSASTRYVRPTKRADAIVGWIRYKIDSDGEHRIYQISDGLYRRPNHTINQWNR